MAEHTPSSVADRYGTRRKNRLDRWIGWTLGALLVIGGIVFLATGGLPTAESSIEYNDISHTIDENGTEVTVTFDVTAPVGSVVACELEALNPSYAAVGTRIVEYPPSDTRTRKFTEALRTHNLATTVTVSSCWVQPKQ